MSWRPDPGSIATDALSQPWMEIRGFAFPPFSLIGRCLSKVKREKMSELILVAPVWPTQPWFAVLLLMLYQKPIIPSEVPIPVEESPQRTSPIDAPAESSRVASVRNSLQGQGISGAASSLILSSWRKATEAAYSCNWRRWERWCASSGCNPVCAPLSSILDFLASEYAEGKQYRTLNSYRSAISMTHSP